MTTYDCRAWWANKKYFALTPQVFFTYAQKFWPYFKLHYRHKTLATPLVSYAAKKCLQEIDKTQQDPDSLL